MKSFPFPWQFVLLVSLIGGLASELFRRTPVFAESLVGQVTSLEIEPDRSHEQFRLRPIPEAELRRMVSRGGASRRGRAGTRGDCPAVTATPGLTAIVPMREGTLDNKSIEMAVGTTASAYPTFWFYLPYANENLHSVRFVVNDDSEMPLFEPIIVPLNHQTPGLVSVQLPPSVPPLEIGKYYHWYVIVDCSPEGGSDAFVDAFVQRVEIVSGLSSELEAASLVERADLLINNHLWHEAVDALYILQAQMPSVALRRKWTELLTVGGLSPTELSK